MTVASGNSIGLIARSAAKIEGEVSGRTTAEGSAKRTADEIAEKLKAAAQRQGWIWPPRLLGTTLAGEGLVRQLNCSERSGCEGDQR